jgi:hypothetical protein
VFGEEAFADSGLVVEAIERSFRTDFDEVAIALFVFGQHQQVVITVALRFGAMIFFLADVEFAANDRLYTSFLGGIHEMYCAEDVAVIRHGHGRHAEFFGSLAEQLDVAGSVEHGVIGMQMKMDELSWRSGHRHPVSQKLASILPSGAVREAVDYLVQIQGSSNVG